MGHKCFVPFCKSGYSSNKEKVALFAVPKDEHLLAKWKKAISRKDRELTVKDHVCEKHFKSDDIVKEWKQNYAATSIPLKNYRLKKNAIPHIFPNCPGYLTSGQKKRRMIVKHDLQIKKKLKPVPTLAESSIASIKGEYNTKCTSEPLSTDTIQKYDRCKCQEKDIHFTQQDEELLRNITAKYKHIIDNVQSDTDSLQDKEVAWAEITIQFNAQCSNESLETKDCLKQYYQSRFSQSKHTTASQEEDVNIKTEEVVLKAEMLPEETEIMMIPVKQEIIEDTDESAPRIEFMIPVKQEIIEEINESAPGIEEIILSPLVKQEFFDEEETAIDPSQLRA